MEVCHIIILNDDGTVILAAKAAPTRYVWPVGAALAANVSRCITASVVNKLKNRVIPQLHTMCFLIMLPLSWGLRRQEQG